jgi:hypothetical protein
MGQADHGSPVIIGPVKPYVIGEQFFPEAQTGFEVLGTVPVGEKATLGYHLTLSNGRGPVEQYQDYDNNKAIGGRLFLRGYWLGDLTIGASCYGGTVTDARQEVDVATQSVKWCWRSYRGESPTFGARSYPPTRPPSRCSPSTVRNPAMPVTSSPSIEFPGNELPAIAPENLAQAAQALG